MEKLYDRIDWHNNETPSINETNLNLMSKAIDDIDDRVVTLADDIFVYLPQIKAYLDQAEDLVEALELMTANPPYIGANGNWYVWNTEQGAYVDSGVDASITVQIADVTAIAPDAQPYVTNTGTNTDPIFHLYIPRGQKGDPGDGDMDSSVYDPDDDVADAGGIPAYIEDTIVANPQDTASTSLTKLKIGDDVFNVGGGNTEYTELTQAQYDALSQAEKENGELYFITDGEGGGTDISGKTDLTMIAPVEAGATSSRAYAKGAEFIIGGILRRAKNPIAQGDAFTSSNMELADSVTEQIHSFDFESTQVTELSDGQTYVAQKNGYLFAGIGYAQGGYQEVALTQNGISCGYIFHKKDVNSNAVAQTVYICKGITIKVDHKGSGWVRFNPSAN